MKLAFGSLSMAFVLVASSAFAGAPLDGVYSSGSGDMQLGRFSESWAGGGQGQLGNTVHAQSWDGLDLGLQWEIACPLVAEPPELIQEVMDEYGNGFRTYRTVYSDGWFLLAGSGPWGNGDPEYLGILDHYVHTTTFVFYNWVPIAYTTNVELAGHFEGYDEQCMQVTVANAAGVGNGAQPANYPIYLEHDVDCIENSALLGEWGDVQDITLTVMDCGPSAANPQTWGMIKSMYR